MPKSTNILRSLSITIVAVVLVALALGSTGFFVYFRTVFAPNVLDGVKTATDGLNIELKNREAEFTTRKSVLESDFNDRLSHDLTILQQTVPATLWNLEPDVAESIARAFLDKKEITAIRVDDDTGKLFSALQKHDGVIQVIPDLSGFTPEGKSMTSDLFKSDKKVGKVYLYYTEAPLRQQQDQVDTDLSRFQKENDSLVGSINTILGATITSQTKRMLALRACEMVLVFVATVAALTLFVRFKMKRPLSSMLQSLGGSSGQIKDAAVQVASSATSVADETSKQAAAVEETTATVEELSAMTRNNAENATETNRLMTETRTTVTQANSSMKVLFDSIQEIQRSSAETLRIIKTIDNIAFQTNILALNAAVESARAGVHGAGFGVVADEVRTLARQSADAAKETADLIENTHRQVAVVQGLVEETRNRFTEVHTKVQHSGELVTKIAEASTEQARGIEQLNSAIFSIDKAVQQTAASAEESAAASEEMRAQTSEVDGIITNLRQMVGVGDERRSGSAAQESRPVSQALSPRIFSRQTPVRSAPVRSKHAPRPAPEHVALTHAE